MTTNQIAYYKAREEKRHNRAMEDYNQRNLDEATRHNLASELTEIYKANRSYDANIYSADSSRAAAKYTADTNAATSRYVADVQASASRYSADRNYAGTVYSADKHYAGVVYSADMNYLGTLRKMEADAWQTMKRLDLEGQVANQVDATKRYQTEVSHYEFLLNREVKRDEMDNAWNIAYLDALTDVYSADSRVLSAQYSAQASTFGSIASLFGRIIPSTNIFRTGKNTTDGFNTPKIK